MKKLALLSVTDKSGLVALARELGTRGYSLLASDGTAAFLAEAGIAAERVGEYTGTGERFGGRVKTLSPLIFGGILARRDEPRDAQDLDGLGALPIDVVVVNLYRLGQGGKSFEDSIDIGGHALLRAAAKNWRHVAVAISSDDYAALLQSLEAPSSPASLEIRGKLATRAWEYAAEYDRRVAEGFSEAAPRRDEAPPASEKSQDDGSDRHLDLRLHRKLGYGENPHQSAEWYRTGDRGFHDAELLHGAALSWNNVLDSLAAMGLAQDLGKNAAVVVKHQSPCGAARLENPAASAAAAIEADRLSAYGGVMAVNGTVKRALIESLKGLFLDLLIATAFSPEALEALSSRKKIRVVRWQSPEFGLEDIRGIPGGALVQTRDTRGGANALEEELKVMTARQPLPSERADMLFANAVVKHVRSNAIVIAKNGATLGICGGQVNRLDAVRMAVQRAGDKIAGAAMASDAFFPFPDGVEAATGVAAVVEPGGSIRDDEVVKAAERLGMTLCFTGTRHFKH